MNKIGASLETETEVSPPTETGVLPQAETEVSPQEGEIFPLTDVSPEMIVKKETVVKTLAGASLDSKAQTEIGAEIEAGAHLAAFVVEVLPTKQISASDIKRELIKPVEIVFVLRI